LSKEREFILMSRVCECKKMRVRTCRKLSLGLRAEVCDCSSSPAGGSTRAFFLSSLHCCWQMAWFAPFFTFYDFHSRLVAAGRKKAIHSLLHTIISPFTFILSSVFLRVTGNFMSIRAINKATVAI